MAALSKIYSQEAGMFEFSNDVPIDIEHTLDQLLGRFSQVRDGLPELIKNSKDQYLRLGVSERSERQIVVVINTKLKKLAVLDFAGASTDDFALWPEVGSRAMQRLLVADEAYQGGWLIVQEGRYRYMAVSGGDTVVRGVLSEYLGFEVIWE